MDEQEQETLEDYRDERTQAKRQRLLIAPHAPFRGRLLLDDPELPGSATEQAEAKKEQVKTPTAIIRAHLHSTATEHAGAR